ncbi:Acg family FMN-binding oxidoreductase [Pseudonocardia lacus]|uniref:Acg family FMN-binding oxidoreductase n=1 Tax=Pseudonocardia lacus TaxID=2835865 RepID=UPI001BDC0327|nr:nitroreductase family protein [Pseudonocardia lacus]
MNQYTGPAVDERTVRAAIDLASRAPSVHNSQPWRWVVGPRSVHLYADLRRWLPATDADGRDMALSCGAVLHHLRVALSAAGLAAEVHRLPNPDEGDHLAAVTLRAAKGTGAVAEADLGLAIAISERRTDRRRYGSWDVPSAFVDEMVARAAEQGAVLRVVSDGYSRRVLLGAIRDAARIQESDPRYRAETAAWTGMAVDGLGVPPRNLLRDPVGTGGDTARRFTPGTLDQGPGPDGEGAGDGALLLVLGTASDDTLSQLRAGEAASAVMLHATRLGLATCPLSQPLEVGETRIVVRDRVLGGTLSPQLVLRVGWAPGGKPLPATPRRAVDDTIERMPR